jgi:hypothetical protein
MKIQFNQSCEIEVWNNYDEILDSVDYSTALFNSGDIVEFEVFGHPEKFNGKTFEEDTELFNVKFNDGSVAYGISKDWFTILEN